MPTSAPPRDLIREEIIREIKRKRVLSKDIINATGMSKNTYYDFIRGSRGMRSGNVTKILRYLRTRRVPGSASHK